MNATIKARVEDKVTKKTTKLLKSCGRCRRRKRKCDGGHPCGRCVDTGDTCSYSKRRPRAVKALEPGLCSAGSASDPSIHAEATLRNWRGAPVGLLQHDRFPLKRCRLRASAATGLVGMQENAFLSDYFGCMGFMPFTTQSKIRETLVKLFVGPGSVHQSENGDYSTTDQHFDTVIPANSQLPADPSTCVFWSAVGLGALLQGRPTESVEKYSRLARDALANNSGSANTEVASAWTILAYLSDFSGDMDNHRVYQKRASDMWSVQEAHKILPVGFADIVKRGQTMRLFAGELDSEEMDWIHNQERPGPQVNELVAEHDICRFILQSERNVERAIAREIVMRQAATAQRRECIREGFSNHESADRVGAVSFQQSSPQSADSFMQEEGKSSSLSSLLDTMKRLLRTHGRDFTRLQHATNRGKLQEGTFGLMLNNGIALDKAARNDTQGILQNLGRCVEVIERYPGLCRCTKGQHGIHMELAMLVHIDGTRARALYHRLRATYSSAQGPGAVPIPPFEEWQGVSAFCDQLFCRLIERVIVGEDRYAPRPTPLQEPVTERVKTEPPDMQVYERETVVASSARMSLGATWGSPAQEAHRTTSTTRESQMAGALSCEGFGGFPEAVPGERRPSTTTRPEESMAVKSLLPSTVWRPTTHSKVVHAVGEHGKADTCTGFVTQEAGVLWSSESNAHGDLIGEKDCGGIDAEDWLDVTHAMFAIGRSGFDSY